MVISRWDGDKRVGSLPYSLAVNANSRQVAQLRMGASVPVPSLAVPANAEGLASGPLPGPIQYRDIGTNIDCNAETLSGGVFRVVLTVSDMSVYTSVQDTVTPTAPNMPVFRSFRSSNELVLRDGQTRSFTAAADRVSGEVVRIEITLTVIK